VPPAGAPPPGGFNFVVMGAAVAIALILLALAWLYLAFQAVPGAGEFMPAIEKPVINAMVAESMVLTSGDRNAPTYITALFVDYDARNLQNLTVQLTPYSQRIPSEVFVLVSDRSEETKSYPEFIRELRADLAKRQVMLNEITFRQLATLPDGAIVIVPSGTVPAELLGFDSPIDINALGSRGMVMIYIGQPFTYMLNGSLSVATPPDKLHALPISFDETANLQSSGDFHLKQPLYSASAGGGWRTADPAYGSVSVLTNGDGAFLLVPQTLDFGWDNASIAAEDISMLVFDTPWAQPSAPTKNYTFADQAAYSGQSYFFTEASASPNTTVKVEFIGYSNSSSNPLRETLVAHARSSSGSGLFIEQSGRVIPFNVTGEAVRMNARLREPIAAQPDMYLAVYDANGSEVQTFPQGNVNVQGDKSFAVPVYSANGEYLVRLMDDSGRVYAQSFMNVVSLNISYEGQEKDKPSIYLFNVKMGEDPFMLGFVSVSVDGGRYGNYNFTNVNNMQIDVGGSTGGEALPLGNHSFEFTSGEFKTDVAVEHYRPYTIFDNPIFWIVAVLTLGIVGIGILFARQEETFYAIDIPDFPPVARTRIPLSPDAVVSIFEKLNETYRWQNTPLTAAEVKNGFKDIFVQGKPIIITDYNVEYLLDELEKKGRVRESLGYYGLTEWAAKTGRSMDYMALMRRLRDICVNNAVPFTGIGESKEADSVITVVGQQMFVHFYGKGQDAGRMISRMLSTISKGITIVLFKFPPEKDAFRAMLDSSPSAALLIAKMEADGGSLQLLTADEFEKMLLEFKSM
jgi:hypothetical protein